MIHEIVQVLHIFFWSFYSVIQYVAQYWLCGEFANFYFANLFHKLANSSYLNLAKLLSVTVSLGDYYIRVTGQVLDFFGSTVILACICVSVMLLLLKTIHTSKIICTCLICPTPIYINKYSILIEPHW